MSGNFFTRWSSVILKAFGLAMVCDLRAQHIVPSVEWERLYADEACYFDQVIETSDQGYVMGGRIVYDPWEGDSKSDYSLVKLDGQGAVQWARVYGGTGEEGGGSLHKTIDGGYIFATASSSAPSGSKDSPHFGQNDVWIVKVDGEGRKQWERSIGGSGDDTPVEIWQTVDEGFMLAAILPGTVGEPYYWLNKLSAQGQTEWERSLGGSENGNLGSLTRAADGGYALAGASHNGPFGGFDGWVTKVDPEGNKQWENFFGGTGDETFISSDKTADGGFILGGSSSSPPSGNKESPHFALYDYWLVKVDGAGKKQWDRSYTNIVNGNPEKVRIIRQTTDQGFIFAGNSQLIKTDSAGNPDWEKLFGVTAPDFSHPSLRYTVEIKGLLPTKEGGYVLAGTFIYLDTGSSGEFCQAGGWAAKLEPVVARSGEVVTWKTSPGVVLESVETLDGEWTINQTEVLSIGGASAISLVPAGQQRYYRLRAAGDSAELPSLSLASLLSWPVDQNQALEFSTSKDESWAAFLGDWGSVGATNYAIVPQSLRQHYFRTKKSE